MKLPSLAGLKMRVSNGDVAKAYAFKQRFFWTVFKALDFNGIDGDYVEFGSHGGMTFRLAHDQIRQRKIKRHLWAVDSFRGLPNALNELDSHPKWKLGAMQTRVDKFHKICRSHGIAREAYTVIEGFYDETLPNLPRNAAPNNIALVYIDCDLYSSTEAVLNFIRPRLKHGMILAFDDYFCWSADQVSGERLALLHALPNNTKWHFLRYRDFGWAGTSFIVERADLLSRPEPKELT